MFYSGNRYSRSRTSCCTRRCLVTTAVLAVLLLFLLSTQIYVDLSEKSFFRKFKVVKQSWFERQYVGSWIQNKLLSMKWESYVDMYCRKGKSLALGKSFTEEDYLNFTPKIGQQLNFRDGESIFDNGCGCGAFLAGFNHTYKNVKVGGLDLSEGAIRFAKEIFPEREKNFKVGTVEDLSFVEDGTFDHAMTFFTFPYVSPEVQCKSVKEMLRIIKSGGSLYIGHNLEIGCKKNHIGIYTLPLCFWNEHCLRGNEDVAGVYYIRERELFGVVKYCPEKTAVFVYKKGTAGSAKLKLPSHSARYECSSLYPPTGRKQR